MAATAPQLDPDANPDATPEAPATLEAVREALRTHVPERQPDKGQRRAAVAVLFRCREGALELFFIKRAEHPRDPWSGHMAFPGGRVDAGDDSSLAAAIRETREEVGFELDHAGRLLGRLDEIVAVARGRRLPLVIEPFVFEWQGDALPRPNAEVEAAHWIPVADLLDPQHRSTLAYEFEGTVYDLPCFRVASRVIWGLTYQMLMRLFAAVGWPRPSMQHPHFRTQPK